MRQVSAGFVALILILFAAGLASAQSCPPNAQARALEARGDPFGTYCMRAFQAQYARNACGRARSGMDMDECQYLSEMLIEGLQRCAARGGPYGARCAAMMGEARSLLATVNRNPVLLQHRRHQREEYDFGVSCRADIGTQCMARCSGNPSCMAACNSASAGQCNR